MQSQEGRPMSLQSEHEGFGLNRTGIMLNPEQSAELIDAAEKLAPRPAGENGDVTVDRSSYVHEALPIGSPPTSGMEATDAGSPSMQILLDKLGERLAFERQGARLYQAFLHKLQAGPSNGPGPSPDDLRHICDEEVEHFKLLQHAITELGGDPTVQTPSADVAGVLSYGVIQIVSDPRSSIAQTLQAMLTAELADNDGWEMLGEVAGETGYDELAKKCEKAFAEEQEHLENVRGWLTELTLTEVAGDGSFAEEAGVAKERKASGQDSKRSKRGKRSQKRGTTKRRKK